MSYELYWSRLLLLGKNYIIHLNNSRFYFIITFNISYLFYKLFSHKDYTQINMDIMRKRE